MRIVTDNGANYRARTFTAAITSLAPRHQRTRSYTPRHNGKVERYNRILVGSPSTHVPTPHSSSAVTPSRYGTTTTTTTDPTLP